MGETRPRRGLSIRARTSLGATIVVALAFVLGGWGITAYLQRSLEQGRQDAAFARAQDVAGLAATGDLPTTLSSPGEDAIALQVVDPSGQVVAATANIDGEAPLVPDLIGTSTATRTATVPKLKETVRVVTVSVDTPTGPATVYAAASLQPAAEAVAALRQILLLALPAALAVVAVTTWVVTGQALQPVEAIRTEVGEISAGQLHRRVPQPTRRDEIGRLAETMNVMLARVEVAIDQQRRFVADASHELRTPLTSTHAMLGAALATSETTNWPALARDLLSEQQRIERLVDDLLLLARLDAAPSTDHRDVDLDELVRVELSWRARTGSRPARYSTTCRPHVGGNPRQLTRVLRNLLDNAERHGSDIAQVELSASRSMVELRVSDDGPGIPDVDRERVFDRFTRLDGTRTRADGANGSGLGLAIVKDIVTAHRGTVTIEHRPVGIVFVIRLPLTTGIDDRADEPDGAASHSASLQLATTKMRP